MLTEDDERELDMESEEEDEDLGDYLVVSSSGGGSSVVSSRGGLGSSSSSLGVSSGGAKVGKRRERSLGQVLDKRAHHNALERKRRDHIKDSFTGLRDAIPIMAGDKSSRAQILKKASDYICYMRKKTASHSDDIDDLKRQNMHLEEQIRALERAKNMGGTLASSDVVLANAGLQQQQQQQGSMSTNSSSSSSPSVVEGVSAESNGGGLLVSITNDGSPATLISTSKMTSSSSSSSQGSSRRIIVPGQSLLIPKDNAKQEKLKVQ